MKFREWMYSIREILLRNEIENQVKRNIRKHATYQLVCEKKDGLQAEFAIAEVE